MMQSFKKSIKILITFFLCSVASFGKSEKFDKNIVVCGDDKVLIVDASQSDSTHNEVLWQWTMEDTKAQLPKEYWNRFLFMDECKPVDKNRLLLVTSSSDASMVIDIAKKKCIFYAYTPMAHSIELLPRKKVVVALSTRETGNSLEVYDLRHSDHRLFRDSLYSGHGVYWCPVRKKLYAIGGDELRIYRLEKWRTKHPALSLAQTLALPVGGAHDLTPLGSDSLLISCTKGIYVFNMNCQCIDRYEPLRAFSKLKSVNIDHTTGRMVYTKAEESWWTHHVYFMNPEKKLCFPDINLYKVRPFRNSSRSND